MSEEVALAAGDIAYWQRRAEMAEADAAAFREALDFRHSCENCGGKGSYWADNDGEAESEVCDCWLEADNMLQKKHAGAALLKELEAARAVIGTLREWMAGDVSGSAVKITLLAYNEAVKGGSE